MSNSRKNEKEYYAFFSAAMLRRNPEKRKEHFLPTGKKTSLGVPDLRVSYLARAAPRAG
jgi:hypothetical protein